MRLLHVAESIWGGCGTYLNEIMPLQGRRFGVAQVRCLIPRQHAAHLADVLPEMVWTFDRPSRRAGLPRLAFATWTAVRRWRPDLIHAHSTFAGAVVRLLSCLWPMPSIIYCPHGWAFEIEQSRAARTATRMAERLLSYRTRRIIAISVAERLQGERAGIHIDKLVVVPNGINARQHGARAEWNDPRLKLLFVGRLDRQKGVDVLLAAVQSMSATVCLRIVGEQVVSERSGLPTSGCAPHVEYLGWRDNAGVAAQINACDLVVMPSRWEGFGLVAVEAMRAAKPVVASSVGGLTEIVVDGVTGLLVPPDNPSALRAALTRHERATLLRMGASGRRRFLEHYTSDRTHRGLLQVYADVLYARAPVTGSAAGRGAEQRRG